MEKNKDSKIWEWVKEQSTKPRTYLILLAISLLIPFVINWLYKFGDRCSSPLIITKWNADDVLSFYGSYLSFLGTTVLGIVTVYQTRKAHQQTEKANNLAEQSNELAKQMQKLEQSKFFSIISIKKLVINERDIESPTHYTPYINSPIILDMVDREYWSFKDCYHFDVVFENISDYPIVDLQAKAKGHNGDATIKHGIKDATEQIYIDPHKEQAIRFIIPSYFFEKYKNDGIIFNLEFINVFDYSTFVTIKIDELAKNYDKSKVLFSYQIQKISDAKQLNLPEENKNIESEND
ncbi:MAG: hypothetical protein IKL18_06710 [Oscillospiraceae bacterium]|nr:hypothetical protein [Oscillospiraceae bacterium]